MRIFQRNVFNCVAKAIMSGIRICKANASTALPMDHAVEILQMEPTWSYPERVQLDTPELRDLQHSRNQRPPPVHLRDLSIHPMDAIIPTSSNANPSTASDVRSRPISNNAGRCSEHNTGPQLKDKFTPRKSSRKAKRQNKVININGYKKWVRECYKEHTYRHNFRILCQGRENNPIHADVFNELIENLKEKMQYGAGPRLIVNAQC